MTNYIPDFADFVRRHAEDRAEKIAIIDGTTKYSWAAYHALVHRAAVGLARAGINKHDRVAIVTNVPIEFLVTFAAVVWLGATVVPLPVGLGARAQAKMAAHCESKLVVAAASSGVSSVDISFDELIESGGIASAEALRTPAKQATDLSSVSYTSGTTEQPKGISRSREAQHNSLRVLARHNDFTSATVYLVATAIHTPMTWGVVTAVLAAGGLCVFPQSTEPSALFEMSRFHRPTFMQMVPTTVALLLADAKWSNPLLPSCRRVVIGGARMDAALKREVFGILRGRCSDVYGTSESGAISDCNGSAPNSKLASVGRLLEDARVEILERCGSRVLPRGDTGDIVVRTSRLMSGYLGDAAEPDSLWWSDASGARYARTGDVGYLDADGYLWIQDRNRDVIITGGYNVFPSDIESVLAEHPAVLEAAVIGKPHDILGEVPIAFVVLRTAGAISTTQLRAWANALLDSKRRVHALDLVDRLPRNESGKVLKRLLQRR
jgi:long-chain acyl-CoA synthetase